MPIVQIEIVATKNVAGNTSVDGHEVAIGAHVQDLLVVGGVSGLHASCLFHFLRAVARHARSVFVTTDAWDISVENGLKWGQGPGLGWVLLG